MKSNYEKVHNGGPQLVDSKFCDYEVDKYPLLTKKEEKNLFITIGKQKKLISKLTDEEEIKKEKKILNKLVDKIVKANIGLVINIASRYNNSNNDLNDLIQEGNIGLLTAINKFDPKHGFKFSTYATYWIRQKIHRYLVLDRALVLPYNKQEKKVQLNNIVLDYTKKHGIEPTDEELLRIYNDKYPNKINIQELEIIKQLPTTTNSLDQEFTNLEDGKIIPEQFKDEDLIDEIVTKQIDMDMVDKIVDEDLTNREKYILERRYGLNNEEILTYQKIGDSLKLSKSRVRDIEKNSLKELGTNKTLKLLYLDYFKGGNKHD